MSRRRELEIARSKAVVARQLARAFDDIVSERELDLEIDLIEHELNILDEMEGEAHEEPA